MSFSRESLSAMVRFLLMPPGIAPVPWIFLPAVTLIISWPYLRIITPCTASSGYFFITPITFLTAGSASNPKRRSGETRWKK